MVWPTALMSCFVLRLARASCEDATLSESELLSAAESKLSARLKRSDSVGRALTQRSPHVPAQDLDQVHGSRDLRLADGYALDVHPERDALLARVPPHLEEDAFTQGQRLLERVGGEA